MIKMSLEGTIFPERKELKNIRMLIFPKGYLGLELITYGLFILMILFLDIYGCIFSLIAGVIFILVGINIQLNISLENDAKDINKDRKNIK